MTDKVLFVDDDQMLLSSMARCLGNQFNLDTALSGSDALAKIDGGAQYAVIISDMRMPVMGGIEFIQEARKRLPDASYLVLTGNQDVSTALRAVKEGQVMQVLNKPLDPDEIAATIDLGLRQYELGTVECAS